MRPHNRHFVSDQARLSLSAIVSRPSVRLRLKILGVTVTNGLSVSLHIQAVISSCAQTLYALRVLRAHGLHDSALQSRDDREWLFIFPLPPIPMQSIPIPSHSHPIPRCLLCRKS